MEIRFESTDPWYIRHGAMLVGVIGILMIVALLGWGMMM